MIRLIDINGHVAVAGLTWSSLAGSTAKGIDAKERAMDFAAAAYLKGKSGKGKSKRNSAGYLAAGYAEIEEVLRSPDAAEEQDILKQPSLMLWFIEEAKKKGIGYSEELGVNGVFKIDLGNGEYWIGAVRESRPLSFVESDWVGADEAMAKSLEGLIASCESVFEEVQVFELTTDEIFDDKPKKNVGVLVKGRSSTASTAIQLVIVFALLGGIAWFLYQIFLAEPEQVSRKGPSDAELRRSAMNSYQQAMQRDFGYVGSAEAYDIVMSTTEGVPVAVESWSFIAANCGASSSECVFKFESPGYGVPSVLEDALGAGVQVNLGGREALFRKPVSFSKEIDRDFIVPASDVVRSRLLDTAAFLRSPALDLNVELSAFEKVTIDNSSFLRGSTFTAEYQKGGISVSGPVGLLEVAAHELSMPGVLVTEIVINNEEFAMRGHYAFQ
ncbi:hypothetical protein [Marinobacter sp.]|uniref:hypothetical protein n=1 Tax=Marinobacter sp. TaxID=50741 RepID=UPI0035644B68